MEPGGSPPLGLCLRCRGRLRPLRPPCCSGCARPLEAASVPAGYLCARCRERPPPWEVMLAGWSYEPPFERVIQSLKFGRLDYLGIHLGRELARRFGHRLRDLDVVAPVPLHWRREAARGYNQAERIARELARRLGLPMRRILRRARATPPQTAVERERRERSVRGAFRLLLRRRLADDLEGRRILLVDDVVTTGATLRAAARCLTAAGAEVTALAAARTPEPELRQGA